MKREVRVFIEGRQLDLFNDEMINVTSSVQNINDISKTNTDISQSFTVPGTPRNNRIFQHFYENSVSSTYDYQLRKDGYIEVDMTTFRKGKIQLEKSNVKNGLVNSYTITFYGELLNLKDLFGEDKLSILDYSSIEHLHSLAEVTDRINGTISDPDVAYPLITPIRIWQYDSFSPTVINPNYVTGTSTNNDIDTIPGAINYREFFPAVRVIKIMEAIEAQYGIKFVSNFFADEKFNALYLLFKNRIETLYTFQAKYIDFSAFTSISIPGSIDPSIYVNLSLNSINFQYVTSALPNYDVWYHKVFMTVTSVSSSLYPYYIDVYKNGALNNTITKQGTTSGALLVSASNVPGLNDTYLFKVRSSSPVVFTIDMFVTYEIYEHSSIAPSAFTNEAQMSCVTQNLPPFLNLQTMAPDMRVADFFSGIMRQFNMVCVPMSTPLWFNVEPLLDWYTQGAVIDITKHTDIDTIDVDRVKLYKNIDFKFQKSESAMNKAYFSKGLKEYGDTSQVYPYDGGEFKIEVPFENLLFNQFGTSGLQVGYCLDSALAPYVNKPILLYKYGMVTGLTKNIVITDGTTHLTSFDYLMFGQDFTGTGGVKYSINFAPETSSYHLEAIQYSIFAMYYFQYLSNLYSPKNRLVTVKTILPISLLTGIQMNDRLIIRDKRYLINEMRSNLVTGEVTFQLLNDLMPTDPEGIIPVETVEESRE